MQQVAYLNISTILKELSEHTWARAQVRLAGEPSWPVHLGPAKWVGNPYVGPIGYQIKPRVPRSAAAFEDFSDCEPQGGCRPPLSPTPNSRVVSSPKMSVEIVSCSRKDSYFILQPFKHSLELST